MSNTITLSVQRKSGTHVETFDVKALACAMFSGRDDEATKKYMANFGEQGMVLPPTNPFGCRISRYLLTSDSDIEVQGTQTSGETEVVAFIDERGPRYISIGSDHCDRQAEGFSVNMPKQLCPKPFSSTVWLYEDVKDHWDELIIEARAKVDGKFIDYQRGSVSSLLALPDLIEKIKIKSPGLVMFCGAIPFIHDDEIYPEAYELSLHDPVLGQRLTHQYNVTAVGPPSQTMVS